MRTPARTPRTGAARKRPAAKAAPRTGRNVRRAAPSGDAAARKARLRRRLKAAGAACLVAAVGAGLWAGGVQLKRHGYLRVNHIAFEGQSRIAESQLVSRLGLPEGIDLPDVDLGAVAAAVLSHPWIERVTVRRSYPDALSIRVWERTPVAVVRTGGRELMVDAGGVVLGLPDPDADALPRLTGIETKARNAGDRVDAARVALGARVARAWGEPGALVDVADPEDPLLLADGLRVRLGADGGYRWRLARLAALQPEIAALAGRHGAEVDLRYDDRVIARPL